MSSSMEKPSTEATSAATADTSSSEDRATNTSESVGGMTQTQTQTQTEQKNLSEEAADKLYEERIEEEYAKREGGA